MIITLEDQLTIRLSFSYNAATVAFVKSLLGSAFDKPSKTWTAPLYHLGAIVQRYARTVSIDYEVLCARDELWRRFIVNYGRLGVKFELEDGVVVAYGEGVSPEFQKHVGLCSGLLKDHLHVQRFPSAPTMPRPHRPSAWDDVEPTDGERMIHAGIVNAAKREEQRAEVVERVKGKRRKARTVQAELLTEEPE